MPGIYSDTIVERRTERVSALITYFNIDTKKHSECIATYVTGKSPTPDKSSSRAEVFRARDNLAGLTGLSCMQVSSFVSARDTNKHLTELGMAHPLLLAMRY